MKTLLDMGFTQGVSFPCCFIHVELGVSVVCHGDEFSARGADTRLDLYDRCMLAAFDCDVSGRLGNSPEDFQEMKIGNRILSYEADPRHTEIFAKVLGFQKCCWAETPNVKDVFEEEVADEALEHEDKAPTEVQHFIKYVQVRVRTSELRFPSLVSVTNVLTLLNCVPATTLLKARS